MLQGGKDNKMKKRKEKGRNKLSKNKKQRKAGNYRR